MTQVKALLYFYWVLIINTLFVEQTSRQWKSTSLPKILAMILLCGRDFSLVLICRRCICEVATGNTWATSRTNENMCYQRLEPSQSFTVSMPGKFNFSQLRRYACGKDWYGQVPGHFSSLIGTVSQAVPAAMAQVHRWHMRTRLFDHVPGKEKDQVWRMFISEHQRKTNVCRFCSLLAQIFFS